MIIDACSLFNELDLLELRFSELDSVVDRFVVVEATRTHKGDAKPLLFLDNERRFKRWRDRIDYNVVDDMPTGDGLAAIRRREMFQRNCILRSLTDAADDDIVLISDCDEIPRPTMIPTQLDDGVILVYLQHLYYFNFNTYAPARPWPGTRACRVADARCLSPHIVRNGIGQPDAYYPRYGAIQDGGWHFSYFGGAERIREKQRAFLHQELVTAENTSLEVIKARVSSGVDIWGRTEEQQFVVGDAVDLPRVVGANPERWAPHFAEGFLTHA